VTARGALAASPMIPACELQQPRGLAALAGKALAAPPRTDQRRRRRPSVGWKRRGPWATLALPAGRGVFLLRRWLSHIPATRALPTGRRLLSATRSRS